MGRDCLFSFVGHIILIGLVTIGARFNNHPSLPVLNIYQVQAVSSQSIASLIQRNTVQSKPKPSVPQIKTPQEVLPQEHRKESQPAKQPSPEVANAAVSNKQSESSGIQGIKTDTAFDFPEYLIEIQERIRERWRPPQLTVSLNTRVFFRISKTGNILQAYVEQPTGTISFDSSALNAVIASDPFSPLPEQFTKDNLGVHFDFIYRAD